MKNRFAALSAAVATVAVGGWATTANAVTDTRTHQNSAGALNLTGSWVGSTVPDSDDIALFDSTMSTASTRNISFGASLAIGGIKVTNSNATLISIGTTSDNGTTPPLPYTLTIGSLGVEMTSDTGSPLTLNQRISLGASQTWSIGTGRSLTTASTTMISAASAGVVVTKTGDGIINYGSGSTSYTNSAYILNGGTVALAQGSTVGSGATSPTSGPLGNGTLTWTSGSITSSNTSAKAIGFAGALGANGNAGILINGSGTVGSALASGQIRLSGNIDLAGGTRTITLYNGSATGGSSGAQLDVTSFQGITSSVANGTLAFAAGANTSSSNRAYIRFGAATPFVGNAGLIIGPNVQTTLAVTNAFGNSILSVPNVTVQSGGILDLSAQADLIDASRNQRIGLLSGAGTVTNAASDGVTGALATGFLVTGTANSGDTSTFSGIIQDGTLAQVGLSKVGASTQILTNANTYGFGTFVGASAAGGGTLLVNNTTGSGTGSGAVQVYAGTLGGTGSVSGAVTIGNATGDGDAFLAPGASIGTFTTTSSATFASDGVLSVELRTTLGNLASDLLVANGATIDPAALFAAVDLGDGTGAAEGTIFTVLSNTSANQIGGAFANLADGGTFTVNGINYLADYQGGDGNDLTLTVVVPEPASLGAIGLASVALLARRRRQSN